MVRWKRINLLSDLSILGRFDVILLRHVLDDLEPALHGRILENLIALMPDDGVLVLSPDDALTRRGRGLAATSRASRACSAARTPRPGKSPPNARPLPRVSSETLRAQADPSSP
jgi:chemotaxis methyl-accepting protein methylase